MFRNSNNPYAIEQYTFWYSAAIITATILYIIIFG